MTRIGMLLDTKTCIGCMACTVACKVEHNNPPGIWMAPVPQPEVGAFPDVRRLHLPLMCMHCEEPACVTACPSGAIRRRPDGIVVIDGDICCGSGACVVACPHGAISLPREISTYHETPTPFEQAKGNYFQPGTAQKCDMCVHRVDEGLRPSCVDACPTESRIWGDLDDPHSEIARRIAGEETGILGTGAFTKPTVRHTVDGARDAGGGPELLALPYRVQTLWDLHHAVEFLLLGIGGGLSLVTLFLGRSTVLYLLAVLFVAVGGLVLVSDLGRPMRFLQAVRNQRASWLSRGAVGNFVYLGLVALLAVRPGVGLAAAVLAALVGVLVMAYPGLALASYAGVKSWHTWLVPASFALDGVAAGLGVAALLQLFGRGGGSGIAVGLLVLAIVRGVTMLAYVARFKQGGPALTPAAQSLEAGRARTPWRVGVIGIGLIAAPVLAAAGQAVTGAGGEVVTALAGACTIVASFAAKLVVLRSGAKPVQGEPDVAEVSVSAHNLSPVHRS